MQVKDLPAIEQDLAQSVAAVLHRRGTVRSSTPGDLEAYDLYLKGRYFKDRVTLEDLRKGAGFLQQSIERNPNYAPALAALASAFASLAYHEAVPDRDLIAQAKDEVAQALRLDDTLAEPHALLAWIRLFYDWDWTGSERELRLSLSLNPDSASAHDWYAQRLMAEGVSKKPWPRIVRP
jgi:serine/threonine-protein kinase